MKLNYHKYFGLFLPLALSGCTPDPGQKEMQKPNVLIIIVDDLGYADIGAYPHSTYDVETPHLDKLAKSGMLFSRAYAVAPVCSPSRVGLFTGKYPQRWGGWRYRTGLPENEKTLAEYFSENGYQTGLIGKNDWGNEHNNPKAREFPLNHGYNYFFGFSHLWHEYFLSDQGVPDTDSADNAPFGPLFFNSEKVAFKDAYTTEIFTDSAVSFLQRNKEHPFLLTLAYNAVHDLVQQVPDSYLAKYELKPIPEFRFGEEDYMSYYKKFSEVGETSIAQMRKYYLANLNCLDDNIGRLLTEMKRLDVLDNSIIIFIGDNGGSASSGSVNYPLSGFKFQTLEGGIRVPLIISWKNMIPANSQNNQAISALDILPTLLSAAKIPVKGQLDGISLLPALTDSIPFENNTRTLFFEFDTQLAIIKGDWKLVKSKDLYQFYGKINRGYSADGEVPGLYNILIDQGERINLIHKEPELYHELLSEWQQWSSEMKKEYQIRNSE
jgi:arylsulfatase A-like enzyme